MNKQFKLRVNGPGDKQQDLVIEVENYDFRKLGDWDDSVEMDAIIIEAANDDKISYPLLDVISDQKAVVFCKSLAYANRLCNRFNAIRGKNIAIVSTRFNLKKLKFDVRGYFPTHQIVLFGQTGDSVIITDDETISVKLEVT